MSERANTLADRFAAGNEQIMQLISAATDAQLANITTEEDWTALMVAHHVALSYRVAGSWARRVAAGEAVPTSRAQIDEGNAHMAQDPTPLTRDGVLAELRDNGSRTEAMIRGFTDEQLATSATMGPAEGRDMTAEQVIKHIILHHQKEHTPHIRAAVEESASA